MAVHMDGARLMNAAVALGRPASDIVADCDTVWLDFTKGLGAPLGAVLCRLGGFHRSRRGAGSSGSAARCGRAA
jgi:threonine aldolase